MKSIKKSLCILLSLCVASPHFAMAGDNDLLIADLESRRDQVREHAYATMSNQTQVFVQQHLLMKREDVGLMMSHLHNLNVRYRSRLQSTYQAWSQTVQDFGESAEADKAVYLKRLAMTARQIEHITSVVETATQELKQTWQDRCDEAYIKYLNEIADPTLLYSPDAIPTMPTKGFSFYVSYSWGSSSPGTPNPGPSTGEAVTNDTTDGFIIGGATAIGFVIECVVLLCASGGTVGSTIGMFVGGLIVGFRHFLRDRDDQEKIESLTQEIYDIQVGGIQRVVSEVGPLIDSSCPQFLPDAYETENVCKDSEGQLVTEESSQFEMADTLEQLTATASENSAEAKKLTRFIDQELAELRKRFLDRLEALEQSYFATLADNFQQNIQARRDDQLRLQSETLTFLSERNNVLYPSEETEKLGYAAKVSRAEAAWTGLIQGDALFNTEQMPMETESALPSFWTSSFENFLKTSCETFMEGVCQ